MESFRYITFSAGGAKGVALCGTLLVLEELSSIGKLPRSQIRGCAGTSIGALFALIYVLCIDSKDMLRMIFEEYVLDGLKPTADLNRLWHLYGIDDGGTIMDFIVEIITLSCITGDKSAKDLTMLELQEATGKELKLCTVDVANGCDVIYISAETHPDMAVYKAVMASMAVPVLFTPIQHDSHLFVDGALLGKVPWGAFPEESTIHFRLISPQTNKQTYSELLTSGFIPYMQHVIDCVLQWHEAKYTEGCTIIDIQCDIPTFTFAFPRQVILKAFMVGIAYTLYGIYRYETMV